MSLFKVKVTRKYESKLHNYNKILKCANINSKLLFLSLLIYYLCYCSYKNIAHDMCHLYWSMNYDGRDKNINSQKMVQLNIYKTCGCVIQNKIYCN